MSIVLIDLSMVFNIDSILIPVLPFRIRLGGNVLQQVLCKISDNTSDGVVHHSSVLGSVLQICIKYGMPYHLKSLSVGCNAYACDPQSWISLSKY